MRRPQRLLATIRTRCVSHLRLAAEALAGYPFSRSERGARHGIGEVADPARVRHRRGGLGLGPALEQHADDVRARVPVADGLGEADQPADVARRRHPRDPVEAREQPLVVLTAEDRLERRHRVDRLGRSRGPMAAPNGIGLPGNHTLPAHGRGLVTRPQQARGEACYEHSKNQYGQRQLVCHRNALNGLPYSDAQSGTFLRVSVPSWT